MELYLSLSHDAEYEFVTVVVQQVPKWPRTKMVVFVVMV